MGQVAAEDWHGVILPGVLMKPMLGVSIDRPTLFDKMSSGRGMYASLKFDGVRALVANGVVLSRSLKPIPNKHVQKLFSKYEGFDGELIVGPANAPNVFRDTTSGVMKITGEPNVEFYVFDKHDSTSMLHKRYQELSMIETMPGDGIRPVLQVLLTTVEQVDQFSSDALANGYEGIILRDPTSYYKYGRSTAREGGLLKIKPFVDAEAEVVGVVELMHNDNVAFTNELGRTARSTAKAGKVPGGTLGALVCRSPFFKETFEIGTGFTAAERQQMWDDPKIIGKLVKFKYLNTGNYDKPRHAVFLGFRDRMDT